MPTGILLFDHTMLTKYLFALDSISANYFYEIMKIGTLQKSVYLNNLVLLWYLLMVYTSGNKGVIIKIYKTIFLPPENLFSAFSTKRRREKFSGAKLVYKPIDIIQCNRLPTVSQFRWFQHK